MIPSSAAPQMRSVSVLVIDDDYDIREIVTEVLQDKGYLVESAHHGAEALELLKSIRPSMILLDLNMPVMDGIQFRKAQQCDPLLRTIPTIVMTAIDRMQEHVETLAATESLTKPFKLPDLLAVVNRYSQAKNDNNQ